MADMVSDYLIGDLQYSAFVLLGNIPFHFGVGAGKHVRSDHLQAVPLQGGLCLQRRDPLPITGAYNSAMVKNIRIASGINVSSKSNSSL